MRGFIYFEESAELRTNTAAVSSERTVTPSQRTDGTVPSGVSGNPARRLSRSIEKIPPGSDREERTFSDLIISAAFVMCSESGEIPALRRESSNTRESTASSSDECRIYFLCQRNDPVPDEIPRVIGVVVRRIEDEGDPAPSALTDDLVLCA